MNFTYSKKLSCVLVTVSDPDKSAKYAHICAYPEVVRKKGCATAILLEDHLSFEECALGCSAVDLLRLNDHDRVVFQVVKHCHFPYLVVLKSALDNTFLEITIKS
jgi:hypothetical protein